MNNFTLVRIMKNLITISFFILIGSKILIAQNRYENYRAVEGGGVKVNIDNETDLNTLILKLENNWELEMTSKGYWIGYTDLMYSIASRKEEAIEPLMNFYNSTSTENGKYGVLYCLHLIGIESTITGRFTENFVNQKARNSLLNYVYSKNEKIRDLAVELLMRDPWSSDVQILMDAMQKSNNDSWTIVNSLMRYQLSDIPFHDSIPTELRKIQIEYATADDICSEEFFWNILKAIKIGLKDNVRIEESLFLTNLWGYSCSGYNRHDFQGLLDDIVENDQLFNYCDLGNKIQYYVENDIIFLCSSMTAKKRWIEWWNQQTIEYKNELKLLPTQPKTH